MRGFRVAGAACARVEVPAHAYLRDSGNEWECERGFARGANSCVPVIVPAMRGRLPPRIHRVPGTQLIV